MPENKKNFEKFDFENYDFKRSLLLCGPTGTGKTWKAEKELMPKYVKWLQDPQYKLATYCVTDAYFKQMVKSNMLCLRSPEDWQTPISHYPLEVMLRCSVLLYDDIWVSDTSDAYLRDLTFILDERIKKGLVTIYTTNLNKEELVNKLNERILSRMLYNTDVVVFKGEDKRLATTKYFEA